VKKFIPPLAIIAVIVVLFNLAVNTFNNVLIPQEKWLNIYNGDSTYTHGQGIAVDENYIWYSSNNYIARTDKQNPDWDNPLAFNNKINKDGIEVFQINSIFVMGNYIYASAFEKTTDYCHIVIKVLDNMTLELLRCEQLFYNGKGNTPEGIVYHNGYWYVILWTGQLLIYDMGFNLVCENILPTRNWLSYTDTGSLQGLFWDNNTLYVNSTKALLRYSNTLKLERVIKHSSEVGYGHGICIDGDYLYMASYKDDGKNSIDNLFKYKIRR